jgi:hypothetical protein
MMTEQRDPFLETLFAEARQELDGKVITTQVMARTRSVKLLLLAGGVSAALILVAGARLIFGIPLFDFAVLISQVLATPLFTLGEGWLALLLLPLNTIASLLVILFKALRIFQKKSAGMSISGG